VTVAGLRRPVGSIAFATTGWVQACHGAAGTCLVPFQVPQPGIRCPDCPRILDLSPQALSRDRTAPTLWLPALPWGTTLQRTSHIAA